MPAPPAILDLVARFDRNRDAYESGKYNEEQLRIEFLNPLFEALGWDVNNTQGHAEAYKDVIHEDAIKIGGITKAPDYCFRIGGTRKFFVEAKKPSVDIKEDAGPAFQLRRYAWSAKLPLSILTDFKEFVVYDCRVKPVHTDKASTARTLYLTSADYFARWDEIAYFFSREAVLKGSFDTYAESQRVKKGTAEVDDAFLTEIEAWRVMLAKTIALRNPKLTQRELNLAVQKTIDRIVFLRICEDRGVEQDGRLLALLNGDHIYKRLGRHFIEADARYNSGLFYFREEKGRPEPPDTLTLDLDIDDKPLKDIIESLYYPHSPYEFSVLPADILGQVYEQFLGKVIRLTEGHQAKIEDKPEVKKAGGVYYTPTYIVDYIVTNTVGKLIEGKKPKDIEKLKILDPACGSGSFLLGAFQHLLDRHLEWYVKDGPEKWAKAKTPVLYQGPGGAWRLTTPEKKRILLNTIYGVDIDPQAVEVTKLSLLLKVLEGENNETLTKQLALFHERALPDLGNNIKCGNSLIGPDFYSSDLFQKDIPPLKRGDKGGFSKDGNLDDEERLRINAFDWSREFPDIMTSGLPGGLPAGQAGQTGGFDAVIGNPPYIRIQTMKEWAPIEVEFYKEAYASAAKGNYDIYVVFAEKGLSLLNKHGRLGFILPSKFFSTDYGEDLRKLITEKRALAETVDFGHVQVFNNATTYTCLLFLTGGASNSVQYAKVSSPPSLATSPPDYRAIETKTLNEKPWNFGTVAEKILSEKIYRNSTPLIELPAEIGRGSSSGADEVFILRKIGKKLTSSQGEQVDMETGILKVPIYATDLGRYSFAPKGEEVIIFPYNLTSEGYEIMSESELDKKYPKALKYLSKRKKELMSRKQFKEWYGFSAPRNLNVHATAQILVPLLADRGLYCRLPESAAPYCLMASGGFSITIDPSSGLSPNYVLGLLNSRLLFWRLRSISNIFRGGWITCTKQYVETLPIHRINFSDPADKARHDKMVALVDQMLDLHKHLAAAKTDFEHNALHRQITDTDEQIDLLVYELYGLTDEEIIIVENNGS